MIKILCVDDERNVLRALERLFLDEDYTIHSAISAAEGLETLEREPGIQVVISDYRMPGMNGVDFLREVCRRHPETVRIVLSGYADTAAVVAAVNEGQIYKFIPKPWNDEELKCSIQNGLEKYLLEKQNARLFEELRLAKDQLEELVAARNTQLAHQNQALTIAHNILDALPVAVVGIDPQGVVVHCNAVAKTFFGLEKREFLGAFWQDILPEECHRIMDHLEGKVCISQTVPINNRPLRVRGTHMKEDDQEGYILVFYGEGVS